jgi:hypothetical protein
VTNLIARLLRKHQPCKGYDLTGGRHDA